MAKEVRVRIAPSPTGFAHIGTAYTALFNFAFARKNKGKFILRLEDTDVKRNVKGAEKAIYEGLKWLGLDWDEGPDKDPRGSFAPYRQSERLKIYKEKVQELLKKGSAYEEEGAIRFKNPGKDISWNDLVRDEISFPGGEVTDFVIMKSDGFPTYNFGVVVDDIEMKISHVIRGEEHISNTPRQLALYDSFGVERPEFAHLPTLRNKERKKLSKRRDPVDLRIFRDEYKILPEALVNFLCLLGWSHPEGKEIFDIFEFIDKFDLSRVRKAGPIFDLEKLEWLNKQYILRKPIPEFVSYVGSASIYRDSPQFENIAHGTAPLIQPRVGTIVQYDNLVGPLFVEPEVDKKLFGRNNREHLLFAAEVFEKINVWEKAQIDKALQDAVKEKGYNTGDFFMDLRIALWGSKVTPPINESIAILGKEATLKRLKGAMDRK